MKHTFVLLLFFTLGCYGPNTLVNGSWTNPNEKRPYGKILVASLTSNTIAKATVEADLAAVLRSKGIAAEKSIDVFPPDIAHTDTDRTLLMEKVKAKGSSAILTISLLNKESESRYVPGSYSYDPYAGNAYYRTFWGYYSYWSPYVYRPGYYVTENTYFIETNLYDVATDALIWSAQSETYNPANLNKFSHDFARVIVDKMQEDGIIGSQGISEQR